VTTWRRIPEQIDAGEISPHNATNVRDIRESSLHVWPCAEKGADRAAGGEGLLKRLLKSALERGLEAELTL
jgi:hypothetical protein